MVIPGFTKRSPQSAKLRASDEVKSDEKATSFEVPDSVIHRKLTDPRDRGAALRAFASGAPLKELQAASTEGVPTAGLGVGQAWDKF